MIHEGRDGCRYRARECERGALLSLYLQKLFSPETTEERYVHKPVVRDSKASSHRIYKYNANPSTKLAASAPCVYLSDF